MPTAREKADKPHYTVHQFIRDGKGHTRPIPAGSYEPSPGEVLVTERHSTRSASARRRLLARWLREIASRPEPAAAEGHESAAQALAAERGRHG